MLLVGDFYYIGYKLLIDYLDCVVVFDKYWINLGNVGFKVKWDI